MEFLLAFLGGLILNIMPCVFPILSLKILVLLEQKKSTLQHGISYTIGVLLSFFIISGSLILLENIGSVVGWGYNLQSPMFVIFLSYVLFFVGLNLSGFFSIPIFAINTPKKIGNTGSFLTGALAVLVATPCTAPFMAPAIGFALTQSPLSALITFQILGLGFALPYLALSMFPKLLSLLPKPGAWMVTFKEFLAFPMYISSAWLLWIAVKQTNSNVLLTAIIGVICIIFTLWLWKYIKDISNKNFKHLLLIILVFTNIATMNINYRVINNHHNHYMLFSEKTLDTLKKEHKKILVAVGADWCLTCKINENLILSSEIIQKTLRNNDIVYVVADWTKRDERITKYIKSFDRIGVPLYVLYDSSGEHKILPQILTLNKVIKELKELI